MPFVAFDRIGTHPFLHPPQLALNSWSQFAYMALFKMLFDQMDCICSTAPVQCNASPTMTVVVYNR